MSRWSADVSGRGQVEPVAALVALLAVGAGLGLYATALDGAAPSHDDLAADAETALDRVEREAAPAGPVLRPDALSVPDGTPQAGTLRVELRADGTVWRAGVFGGGDSCGGDSCGGDSCGGAPPAGNTSEPDSRPAATAERDAPVRVAPGEVVRGTLRVEVRR